MKSIKMLLWCITILFCFTNTQCDEDDLIINDDLSHILVCSESVIVNDAIYNEDDSDAFVIESAFIEDDCITIVVSASGCDSNSWDFDLIASTEVAESNPIQRFLKLKFINTEACLAYFTKEFSFNLTSVQIDNENQIRLNLQNYEGEIVYSY